MGHQCYHERRKERAMLACIICLFITMLLIILIVVLYFSVFKPKDPSVVVPTMRMVSYNTTAGTSPGMTSVQLGLDLEVFINNPNRGVFHMEETSTASMLYGNTQVGITSLPINTPIPSQSFITFGVAIDMQSPILLNLSTLYADPDIVLPMPLATVITLFGHVTTAGTAFSHHSIVVSTCNVNLALARPRTHIQSYVCMKSHPLNN